VASASLLNGTLAPVGYSPFHLTVLQWSYGLNIVAQEDLAANYKAFYARNVLNDHFTWTVQFATHHERQAFYYWALGYARQATDPQRTAGLIRASVSPVPYRDGVEWLPAFDMFGVLADGVTQLTTPSDVTWQMTLSFVGAQITRSATFAQDKNIYHPPTDNAEAAAYFYPESSALWSTKPDALYDSIASYLAPSQVGTVGAGGQTTAGQAVQRAAAQARITGSVPLISRAG